MSQIVLLQIFQKIPVGDPPTAFQLRARTPGGARVNVQVNKGTNPSIYNTNNSPPLVTLNLSDADYNSLWDCPVPSVVDHQLEYDNEHPIYAGVYPVLSYCHCSGTIQF